MGNMGSPNKKYGTSRFAWFLGVCGLLILIPGSVHAGGYHKKAVVVGYVPVTYGQAPVAASPYVMAPATAPYGYAPVQGYAPSATGGYYYYAQGAASSAVAAAPAAYAPPGYAPAAYAPAANVVTTSVAAAPAAYTYGTSTGLAPVQVSGSRLNNSPGLVQDIYKDLKDAYPDIKSNNSERTARRNELRTKAREKYVAAIKDIAGEDVENPNAQEEQEITAMIDLIVRGDDGDSNAGLAPAAWPIQVAPAPYPAYAIPTYPTYLVPVTAKPHSHKSPY